MNVDSNVFCQYPLFYQRRKTRVVLVGSVAIGGENPIRIQSMLTNHTWEYEKCLTEIASLDAAGCEIIRIAISSNRDLAAMPKIRQLMQERGITRPLVADVHFAPHLAVDACEFFEKIRINPGNISDRPKNYIAAQDKLFPLEQGKEKLKERLQPIAAAIKHYGRSLRIGVNHGSLSQRMIQAYGDSPLGMVQSALEAVEIFESLGVENIVVSMKSSNPYVVEKAYRLFVSMDTRDLALPLHLGVTEAGEGAMARMKSVCGLCPLLLDGFGDTIRVSLTENSVHEVAFAQRIINFVHTARGNSTMTPTKKSNAVLKLPLQHVWQKKTFALNNNGTMSLGGGRVLVGADQRSVLTPQFAVDFHYQEQDLLQPGAASWAQGQSPLKVVVTNGTTAQTNSMSNDGLPAIGCQIVNEPNTARNVVTLYPWQSNVFQLRQDYYNVAVRQFPVGILLPAEEPTQANFHLESFVASVIFEKLVDFLLLPTNISAAMLEKVTILLQATRVKFFQTDYVACPSCGRTLFDLQQVTQEIKKHTQHLVGVKIGIMGCLVNGPGEMADADFGYVGSGSKRIDLYVGQKKVQKNIPQDQAVQALIALIKTHGRWQEPTTKNR